MPATRPDLALVAPPEDPLGASPAGPAADGEDLLVARTADLGRRLRELMATGADLLDFEVGAVVAELHERGEQDLVASILAPSSRPAPAGADPTTDADAAALADEVAAADAETDGIFSDGSDPTT